MRIPLAIAIALLAAAVSPVAHAKEFRSADVHPDDYPTVLAVRFMGEEIARRTNGRHSIRIFTGNQVGGEKEMIEQTRIGALDLVRTNVAPMNAICPDTVVPTLPFLFRSKEHMRNVLDGPIGEAILRSCESAGFVGLAFYDSGARSLYTVNRPVARVSDARGLTIRVQQSELWIAAAEVIGAKPMPLPYGEVYTALKAGLVDAAENNLPSYDTGLHYAVAPYYSLTEHSMAPEMLLMSRKVWETLSPDDQAIFRDAARRSVPYMRRLWDEKERASRDLVVRQGAKIIDVDRKSFEEAVRPLYDRFITDARRRRLVEAVQSTK